MGFLDNISKSILDLFRGETDEILFYILVFLIFFGDGLLNRDVSRSGDNDGSTLLFFAVLFAMLLLTKESDRIE